MWNGMKYFASKVFTRTVIFCSVLFYVSLDLLKSKALSSTEWLILVAMISVYLGVMSRRYVDRVFDIIILKLGGQNASNKQDS